MSRQIEIWLTGEICSGKDFIGDVLVRRFGFWKMGVGELIAKEVEQELGLTPGSIYGTPGMKDRFRAELQYCGNLRRGDHPLYWIDAWIHEREKVADRPAVMTSCRFLREAKVCRDRGATLLRVKVDEGIRQARIKQCYPNFTPAMELNAAEGEIAMIQADLIIDGTLSEDRIVQQAEDLLDILAFSGT
jgi:hypothetical protein